MHAFCTLNLQYVRVALGPGGQVPQLRGDRAQALLPIGDASVVRPENWQVAANLVNREYGEYNFKFDEKISRARHHGPLFGQSDARSE